MNPYEFMAAVTGVDGNGRNDEMQLARYKAELQDWLMRRQAQIGEDTDNRKRRTELDDARQVALSTPQLFGGLIGEPAAPGDVGRPNEHGYIDPRAAGAYQGIASAMATAMNSGNPALQKMAMGAFNHLFDATTPKAPDYRSTNPTAAITEFEYARRNGYQGNFENFLDQKRQALTVNMPGSHSQQFETAYDKTVGEQNGKDFIALQQAPGNTLGRLQTMSDIHNMLGSAGGFMGRSLQELKMAANRLGINVEGLDAGQAAGALENALVLQMRSTADGGGMPGAMSDADRKFLEKSVPGLDMTPGGRSKYLEIQKRILGRQQEVAGAAREYASQNGGRIDYNFNTRLEDIRKRHLFDDIDVARPDTPLPSAPAGITNFRRVR